MENEKTILTKAGEENLRNELKRLIDEERPAVIEQIKDARSQGDLSENADYDAARARQAVVEARIQELQKMLSNVQIIEGEHDNETVKLGSKVEISHVNEHGGDGSKHTYTIVGSVETDPEQGKISNECPLAVALLGRKVNDVSTVKVAKPYKVRVLKIYRQ